MTQFNMKLDLASVVENLDAAQCTELQELCAQRLKILDFQLPFEITRLINQGERFKAVIELRRRFGFSLRECVRIYEEQREMIAEMNKRYQE